MMNARPLHTTALALLLGLSSVLTAAELSPRGKQLEKAYESEMNSLKAEIQKAVSSLDAAKKTAYQQALDAESAARAKFNAAKQATGGVQKAEGLVNHAKGKWIGGAKHAIKQAEAKIKAAKNDSQRKAAEKELEKAKENLAAGEQALKERMEALEMAKRAEKDGPRMIKEAADELARVKDQTKRVFQQIGLGKLIDEGAIDDKLVKYVVLMEGTPQGLAEFAQQSSQHEALIQKLLSDTALMRAMLVADGAARPTEGRGFGPAQYGPAMKIYTDILKEVPGAKDDILHELAIAVALEHAVPIRQSNPKAATDAPEHVDPVKRYLHYAKAHISGELDPAFAVLNAWELRMVVDGEEPDETLAWGRRMLRNYQPAHIMTKDYGWRYVRIVATDVKYGSGDVKYDRPELQNYQNIIMNGGVCGRRAFFGRFILRAFGIPTTARPSRGHAALAHWTPKGWVVNLGPGWGGGWTKGVYNKDRNFLATSQARYDREAYPRVKRAMWIGDAMGEKRVYGEHDQGTPEFWGKLSLQLQRSIIEDSKAEELAALGAEIGESNADPHGPDTVQEASASGGDKQITVSGDGVITVPVAAFEQNNGSRVIKSFDGGLQVNMGRFAPEGVTVLRGESSGSRLKSGGYGRYDNWGFRALLEAPAGSARPKEVKLDLGNGVSMEFVLIKAGTFTMGGESDKDGRFECVELPKHKVTLTKDYYLGKYEVTQAQYEAITGDNPSKTTKGPNFPVNNVGEEEAIKFCELASEKTGQVIRVPYEAEWEYAARAGTDTKYFFGDSDSQLGNYAWTKGNSTTKTHEVGQKKPSPWGLYDIYGNVVERTADRYHKDYYKQGDKVDPTGPALRKHSQLTYKIHAPRSGKYALSAKVVTNNHNQHLMASVNEGSAQTKILPFTLGEWQDSQPVVVDLRQGNNSLEIYRLQPPQAGIAVKSFTLTPVR